MHEFTSYQPVSHKIQSKRGSRAQFAAMVSTCNSAGVGILVDAVLNRGSLSNLSILDPELTSLAD